jgi:hypothetical protein
MFLSASMEETVANIVSTWLRGYRSNTWEAVLHHLISETNHE